jgi:membrane protein YdbS with pleckstrin-like domain
VLRPRGGVPQGAGAPPPVVEAGPLVLREHWRVLVLPAVVLFVDVGAAAFLAGIAPDRAGRTWFRLAVLCVSAAAIVRWAVLPWLRWLTTRYEVADGRLLLRTGVFRQQVRAIPLARIADLLTRQDGVVERALGIGTLTVVPEGDREPVDLPGLPRVADVQARLWRHVDLARDAEFHAGRSASEDRWWEGG